MATEKTEDERQRTDDGEQVLDVRCKAVGSSKDAGSTILCSWKIRTNLIKDNNLLYR
jgi:hypothetical protein